MKARLRIFTWSIPSSFRQGWRDVRTRRRLLSATCLKRALQWNLECLHVSTATISWGHPNDIPAPTDYDSDRVSRSVSATTRFRSNAKSGEETFITSPSRPHHYRCTGCRPSALANLPEQNRSRNRRAAS